MTNVENGILKAHCARNQLPPNLMVSLRCSCLEHVRLLRIRVSETCVECTLDHVLVMSIDSFCCINSRERQSIGANTDDGAVGFVETFIGDMMVVEDEADVEAPVEPINMSSTSWS